MAEDKKVPDAAPQEEGELAPQVISRVSDHNSRAALNACSCWACVSSMASFYNDCEESKATRMERMHATIYSGTQRGARLFKEASLRVQVDALV